MTTPAPTTTPVLYLCNNSAPGWQRIEWSPGTFSPLHNGTYQVTDDAVLRAVRAAGPNPLVVDMESLRGDDAFRTRMFQRAVDGLRSHYNDAGHDGAGGRPIILYGLFSRTAKPSREQLAAVHAVHRTAGTVSIGAYVCDSPGRVPFGPSIERDLGETLSLLRAWHAFDPSIRRVVWIADRYGFADRWGEPGVTNDETPPLTDADLATLERTLLGSGLVDGILYWTPRPPDARFLRAFRG